MMASSLYLSGWYAAWLPRGAGPHERCVVFGFRDQDQRFHVELEGRFAPLSDPALVSAQLVGPFRSPEAAQAALYVTQSGAREAEPA